jgi:hypothetical protein
MCRGLFFGSSFRALLASYHQFPMHSHNIPVLYADIILKRLSRSLMTCFVYLRALMPPRNQAIPPQAAPPPPHLNRAISPTCTFIHVAFFPLIGVSLSTYRAQSAHLINSATFVTTAACTPTFIFAKAYSLQQCSTILGSAATCSCL